MARLVKPAKKVTDRRRPGNGDNSPFTVSAGVGSGGLGAGKRISNITSPRLALHQYTNRGAERKRPNGQAPPKKKPQNQQQRTTTRTPRKAA